MYERGSVRNRVWRIKKILMASIGDLRGFRQVGPWGAFRAAGERKRDSDRHAESRTGAAGGGIAAVLAGDVADQKEAEAGALDLRQRAAGHAVEALEDALELTGIKADPGIGDGEGNVGVVDNGQRAADVHAIRGVLHGVIQDVDDSGAEIFGDAESVEANGAGDGFENDTALRKMMPLESDGDAIGDQRFEVDGGAVLLAVALA